MKGFESDRAFFASSPSANFACAGMDAEIEDFAGTAQSRANCPMRSFVGHRSPARAGIRALSVAARIIFRPKCRKPMRAMFGAPRSARVRIKIRHLKQYRQTRSGRMTTARQAANLQRRFEQIAARARTSRSKSVGLLALVLGRKEVDKPPRRAAIPTATLDQLLLLGT